MKDNRLRVGDRAWRISRIDAITPKQSSSGHLLFVKIVHEFHNTTGLSLLNEHTSAFREAPKANHQPSAEPAIADADSAWHRVLTPDPVLLFRYSALMFNSHRIHYDHPYATDAENYPALLVQETARLIREEGGAAVGADVNVSALFLASDEAAFITGECILVDGGRIHNRI